MNRLSKEKSPYLLQHARNPVDWFPWGNEAFEKAARENKMIFLSIGYSTCHWCHVMEKESFENEEVAALLNKDFVPVKVDREERPDIDHIYMTAVQAMTGAGGWPLTVFLTPEGKPVTGGTYFPPEDRWGRPGMKTILPRLAKAWTDECSEMRRAGEQLAGIIAGGTAGKKSGTDWNETFLKAYRQFEASFDEARGGFGGAPKFPRSHELSFLLRYWKKTGESSAAGMVRTTLECMARGGIYDHLGGGFARYSTDENWRVPHFEKMLYDQALLARTYLEFYQAFREPFAAGVAGDIFRYVLRDMTSPEGGFYSAEDADSEGEEGKFYVWRPEEIRSLLGDEAGRIFCGFYGVTEAGCFEHGTSILHVEQPPDEFAAAHRIGIDPLGKILQDGRHKLFEARKKRVPPYKDDKILTAWNGLMISALAYGSQVLSEPFYAKAAGKAADFILQKMSRDGRLLRRFREGEAAVPAFHDDYAFFILGLLDLYETTFEIGRLEEAKRLALEMLRLFWDGQNGGFFYTGSDAEPLIVRAKEFYDGATPSGNSAAALALLRLHRMTGDPAFENPAEILMQVQAEPASEHPMAFPYFLAAADFAVSPPSEVVLAGPKKDVSFARFLIELRKHFEPGRVVLHRPEDGSAELEKFASLAPSAARQKPAGGKTTVYVCANYACQKPVTEPGELQKVISGNEKKV